MKFPILLPNIFNYPFTYESNLNLEIGDFVEVPFGSSKIIGVGQIVRQVKCMILGSPRI